MTWTADVLTAAPISGTVPEAHFDGGDTGPWLWVKFSDYEGGRAWAGCFRSSSFSFSSVEVFEELGDALVVAGGQGYWLSLSEQALRYREPFIAAASRIPGKPLIAVADYVRVSLLSANGPVWRTPRISLDGIAFTAVSDKLVIGEAENPWGHVPFEVEVMSGAFRGGWAEA